MSEEIFYLSPNKITPDPNQPRKRITEEMIEGVAKTILVQGVINPIEIDEDNVIVTGEVRWRGATRAEVDKVPCRRWKGTPEERLERQTIENLHHYELTSIEQEDAIYRLWKTGKYKSDYHEGDVGYGKLAEVLGYSPHHISNIVEAKEFRDTYLLPVLKDVFIINISSFSIMQTRSLSPKQRVAILTKVANEEIRPADIPEYVKVAKRSPVMLESMVLGDLSLERATQTLEIIGEVEKRGVEVTSEMIGHLLAETAKSENIIEHHKEQFYDEVIGVMTGDISVPTKILTSTLLPRLRGMYTFINRWGVTTMMELGAKDWETARSILLGIDKHIHWLLSETPGKTGQIIESTDDKGLEEK